MPLAGLGGGGVLLDGKTAFLIPCLPGNTVLCFIAG